MDKWFVTSNRGGSIPLSALPRLSYGELYGEVVSLLNGERCHCASYFAVGSNLGILFVCLLLDDADGTVRIATYMHEAGETGAALPSLTAVHPEMHVFEREIAEGFGIRFEGNPWDKPLRFAHDRADRSCRIDNYPFYGMQGDSLHEVNVGPIHAGIIEPGVFRFVCNGEQVLHLEIVLGYQHRGIERMMRETDNRLRQCVLAESIAGDSAVAHATAFARVIENFAPQESGESPEASALERERAVALEMERIAMHVADTGALCTDIGFQLGQVACEALRTIVINSTQLWCGNRFGKGLIRPCGSYYPLREDVRAAMRKNLDDVERRYMEVVRCMNASPSVQARFEDCGTVTRNQSLETGAVGPAARASGNPRDIRSSHPWGVYGREILHEPVTGRTGGDIMSRLQVRIDEVRQSVAYIRTLLEGCGDRTVAERPRYDSSLASASLAFSLVEGWRGEICHVGVTDRSGRLIYYKVQDPSLHNWMSLALAVRGAGISDFPICNKSFNLSYCGHDL